MEPGEQEYHKKRQEEMAILYSFACNMSPPEFLQGGVRKTSPPLVGLRRSENPQVPKGGRFM
jgi:hypothetical protein